MHWLLIAITMLSDGQPHELQELGAFESYASCQFAPEVMFPGLNAGGPVLSATERNPWAIRFSCVPTTEEGVIEFLDAEETAALSLAGRGKHQAVWWRERQREIRAIRRE